MAINIPFLNAQQWVNATDGVPSNFFTTPRNTLFRKQRRGVAQSHKYTPIESMQVLGMSSKIELVITQDDEMLTYDDAELSDNDKGVDVTGSVTDLAGDYLRITFDISNSVSVHDVYNFVLNLTFVDTQGNEYVYILNMEPVYIMSDTEKSMFFQQSDSFAIAYNGGENILNNGYYWDDVSQVMLMRDVKLSNEEMDDTIETATSLRGEDEVLASSYLNTYTYDFGMITNRTAELIVRAASLPNVYINGIAVTIDDYDLGDPYNGKRSLEITVKRKNYTGFTETIEWSDYNL